jgi:hypothetical protein
VNIAAVTKTSFENRSDKKIETDLPEFRQQVVDFGRETVGHMRCEKPFMIAENVNVYYGDNHAIKDVTLES